jgi:peroxiredoxin
MSFKSQMTALRNQVVRELPEGAFEKLQAEAANLRGSGKWRKALKAGKTAPDFELSDRTGGIVRLGDLIGGGPVVVCFYRGDWCRFCRLQLRALGEVADEVRTLGASLIAVSPKITVTPSVTRVQTSTFPLLADVDAKVCQAFGLTFLPADNLRDAYLSLGRPAGEASHLALPAPATYVIDQSSTIVFSYFDSDFTSRLDPCEILVVLRRLRAMQGAANPDEFPKT